MSTQLAAQLRVLSGAGGVDNKKDARFIASKASFLFDAKTAADTDAESIFSLGLNGLTELQKIDARFEGFQTSLFRRSGPGFMFDRAGQTPDEIQVINKHLTRILLTLSPHFLLKAAHKVLEFLIRCYAIHEHNCVTLLQCILPYHESPLFARMLQLLRINSLSRSWSFLSDAQKNNAQLSRRVLVARCVKDVALVEFVCEATHKIVALDQTGRNCRAAVAFYTVVLLEVISESSPTIPDTLVRALYPHVVTGLKSKKYVSVQWASYMVLNQLCRATQLDHKTFVVPSVNAVVKYLPVQSREDLHKSLLTLLSIFQSQNLIEFPLDAFKIFIKVPLLCEAFVQIVPQYESSSFFFAFMHALCTLHPRHSNYQTIFTQIVNGLFNDQGSLSLVAASVARLVETLLLSYVGFLNSEEKSVGSEDSNVKAVRVEPAELVPMLSSALHLLESKCPKETQNGLRNAIANSQARVEAFREQKRKNKRLNGSGAAAQAVHSEADIWTSEKHGELLRLISAVFDGSSLTVLDQSGTTLLFSLHSPLPDIRLAALHRVGKLLAGIDGGDGSIGLQSLSGVLEVLDSDTDSRVLSQALVVLPALVKASSSTVEIGSAILRTLVGLVRRLCPNASAGGEPRDEQMAGHAGIVAKALNTMVDVLFPLILEPLGQPQREVALKAVALMLEFVPVLASRAKLTRALWTSVSKMAEASKLKLGKGERKRVAHTEPASDLAGCVARLFVGLDALLGLHDQLQSTGTENVNLQVIACVAGNLTQLPAAFLSFAQQLAPVFGENISVGWRFWILVLVRASSSSSLSVEGRESFAEAAFNLLSTPLGRAIAISDTALLNTHASSFHVPLNSFVVQTLSQLVEVMPSAAETPTCSAARLALLQHIFRSCVTSSGLFSLSLDNTVSILLRRTVSQPSLFLLGFLHPEETMLVTVRALFLINAFLQSALGVTSGVDVHVRSLLPALLSALTSPHEAVRRAALLCLSTLATPAAQATVFAGELPAPSTAVLFEPVLAAAVAGCPLSVLFSLTVHVAGQAASFQSSASFLPLSLAQLPLEMTDNKLAQATPAVKSKKKSKIGEPTESPAVHLHRFLLAQALALGQPTLLAALAGAPGGGSVVDILVTGARTLLAAGGSLTAAQGALWTLLSDRLGHACVHHSEALQVIQDALTASLSFPGPSPGAVTFVSARAFDVLSPTLFVQLSLPAQTATFNALIRMNQSHVATATLQARVLDLSLHADSVLPLLVLKPSAASDRAPQLAAVLDILGPKISTLREYLRVTPALLALLQMFLRVPRPALPAVDAEYMKQALCACLVQLLDRHFREHNSAAGEGEAELNLPALLESAIACVVAPSADPGAEPVDPVHSAQTRVQALRLLVSLCPWAPERLLAAILPVFTVLADALAADHPSVFATITQTLEQLVPPLAARGLSAWTLLRTFADVLPRTPAHCRLPLFRALVLTLGPPHLATCVWLLLSLRPSAELSPPFVHTLLASFPALEQTQCLSLLPSLLSDGDAPTLPVACGSALTAGDVVTDWPARVSGWLSAHLDHLPFLENLLALSAEAEPEAQTHLVTLFVRIFRHVGGTYAESSNEPSDAVRACRRLLVQLADLLSAQGLVDAVSKLLNVDENAENSLRKRNQKVAHRALQFFNERLEASVRLARESGEADEAEAFLKLVPALQASLAQAVSAAQAPFVEPEGKRKSKKDKQAGVTALARPEEDVPGTQTVLLSLDGLVQAFGGHVKHSDMFAAVVSQVQALVDSRERASAQIVASALLCLATLVAQLGTRLLAFLPAMARATIAILQQEVSLPSKELAADESRKRKRAVESSAYPTDGVKAGGGNAVLVLSCLALGEALVAKLSAFLSPYLTQLLPLILHPSLLIEGDGRSRLVAAILSGLSTQLAPRLLLPCVFSAYSGALRLGGRSLSRLFALMGEVCSRLTPEDVSQHFKQIFKFILVGFDLRRSVHENKVGEPTLTTAELQEVESKVVESCVALALRLTEKRLRKLLVKLLDWLGLGALVIGLADEEDRSRAVASNRHRLLAFFSLIAKLTDVLKTLFVPYLHMYLGHAFACLQPPLEIKDTVGNDEDEDNAAEPHAELKPKKAKVEGKTKRNGKSKAVVEALSLHGQLATAVLSCLTKSVGFCAEEKALGHDQISRVTTVLVSQLVSAEAYTQDDPAAFLMFVRHTLCPAFCVLADSASRVGEEASWKHLNHLLCMATREKKAVVRLAALNVMLALFDSLKERWLNLLPEMLPFVVELMEDTDRAVEAAAQAVIRRIEDLSGESLDSHLNGNYDSKM